MSTAIHAAAAPKPVGHYPHARRIGNTLYLSGIGPRSPADNRIPGNVHDTDGRLMSTTNLVIGGGLAIGPAIAGQILERAGGTGTMLVTSGIILGASLTLLCLSRIPSAPLTEPAR